MSGSGVSSNYWRPFQLIVSGLIIQTVGYKPWAFHFASILFHSLCGLLIFAIFRKLLQGKVHDALLTCIILIWSAHPLHNEELAATTGLASPAYLLWMLLGMFSFLLFSQGKGWYWYLVSVISFLFGLFSKESAIIFPALVLGLHITATKSGLFQDASEGKGCFPVQSFESQTGSRPHYSQALRENVPYYLYRHLLFWVIALFYVISRLTFLNFKNTLNFYGGINVLTQNFHYRLYTLFTVLVYGIRSSLVPIGLHPEMNWPVFANFLSLNVGVSFLTLILIVGFALWAWRKQPLFSLGIFWYFVSFAPMSNIIAQINAVVWDHWFYAPSLGIFLGIVGLISLTKDKRGILIFLLSILVVFSFLTIKRNPNWRDTEAFCRFILKHEPHIARVWHNLGVSLAERGRVDEAIDCYKKAIEISDTYPQIHHNLANIYFNQGRYDLAEKEYKRAIELDDKFFLSYLGLGKLCFLRGQNKMGRFYLEKAKEIYPYLSQE